MVLMNMRKKKWIIQVQNYPLYSVESFDFRHVQQETKQKERSTCEWLNLEVKIGAFTGEKQTHQWVRCNRYGLMNKIQMSCLIAKFPK